MVVHAFQPSGKMSGSSTIRSIKWGNLEDGAQMHPECHESVEHSKTKCGRIEDGNLAENCKVWK